MRRSVVARRGGDLLMSLVMLAAVISFHLAPALLESLVRALLRRSLPTPPKRRGLPVRQTEASRDPIPDRQKEETPVLPS